MVRLIQIVFEFLLSRDKEIQKSILLAHHYENDYKSVKGIDFT
jgi:hypothetical protein